MIQNEVSYEWILLLRSYSDFVKLQMFGTDSFSRQIY